MTTERDDGYGPYKPVDQSYLEMLGRGEFSYRRTINLSRELLHLRDRTATLELQLNELEMANSRLEGDVMERLEVWLRSVPIESSTNSVAIGLDYANDGNLVIGLFDEDGDLAECSAPTLTAAIDAALREVEP